MILALITLRHQDTSRAGRSTAPTAGGGGLAASEKRRVSTLEKKKS
jgi:hypothetical protein